MKVQPLYDRVVIERVEGESTTSGGIIIPETAKEKPLEGVVRAVGPGKYSDSGTKIDMQVKVEDRVLFGKYSGTEISIEGSDYLILREDEILAVFNS